MTDPRIIPDEELARYIADAKSVTGWDYYQDAYAERRIVAMGEHIDALTERLAGIEEKA